MLRAKSSHFGRYASNSHGVMQTEASTAPCRRWLTTKSDEASTRSNYLDNLALVDRTLRDLRGVMQRAGVWGSTVVLVTSDHPFRPSFFHTEHPSWPAEENAALGGARDPQIPFILKLSEQTEGVRYDAPFNTVVTHDLLLALMRREVSTPAQVVSWLDRHRSIGQSPYD
jgi:arylsulfatase A-like enzyme